MKRKADIRLELKKVVAGLSDEEKQLASTRLCERLLADQNICHAKSLGIYLPLPDEPDLRAALKAFSQKGYRFALPFPSDTHQWTFNWITDLQGPSTGPWGLEMPAKGPQVSVKDLDIILVPGRGFTKEGRRIGRGKGIYDQLLRNSPSRSIGIAFACQLRNSLPREPHDILMTDVWTE